MHICPPGYLQNDSRKWYLSAAYTAGKVAAEVQVIDLTSLHSISLCTFSYSDHDLILLDCTRLDVPRAECDSVLSNLQLVSPTGCTSSFS